MEKASLKKAVFAESCVPPLQSGEYLMKAVQRSKTLGDSDTVQQSLWVEGPRFALQQEDICSVYPPENSRGSFGSSLPHIAFRRKTLPWERSIARQTDIAAATAASPSFQTPWLALLQLREDEEVRVAVDTVKNVVNPASADIYFPHLHLREGEEDDPCRYIELDTALFRRIFPAEEDLMYLCHARQLDPYVKSDAAGGPDDEWCSAVIGARLPDVSETGRKNRVYLVSLEGYDNYSGNAQIDSYAFVRMVVLHQWTYEAVCEPFHFKEICRGLSVGPLAPETEGQTEEIKPLLENGFLPVRHQIRNGDCTVSFYRGPLTPSPAEGQEPPSVSSADALYIYDPDTGMFDISYACAWQLGRLAVLNQRSIAGKLLKARGTNRQRLHAASLRSKIDTPFCKNSEDGSESRLADGVLSLLEQHVRRRV